ncbi:dodecin [Siccirubricoccus deserti]|uniref:dodecin n=1 Tax=Siccirubricoccus deserti TaxID=2013562 RepID=UPI00361C0555
MGNAISRASENIRNIRWFEVVQVRGEVVDGKVGHYQVTLKIGFTLDEGWGFGPGGCQSRSRPGRDGLV